MNATLSLLAAAALERPAPPADPGGTVFPRGPHGPPGSADLAALLGPAVPSACPHCASDRFWKWGRFQSRQRYRCRECRRTFNDLTGTSLHRLRRKDRWGAFCRCMVHQLTVRQAAARIGVHRDTAFRWRHRLLRELRASELYPLGPRLHLDEGMIFHRTWLLLGLDERGRAIGDAVGRRHPRSDDVAALLGQRVDGSTSLLSTRGPAGAIAGFARRAGLEWRRRFSFDSRYDSYVERVPMYRARFRRWLFRFRGVADHYLNHYLAWFRLLEGQVWRGLGLGPRGIS